jgi:hypothetical protein
MKALHTVNLQSVCGCEHDSSRAPVTGCYVPTVRLSCFQLLIHEPQFASLVEAGSASQQDASATFGWLGAFRVVP